ncbi:MAG TPA: hypothetical protein VKB46_28965, partial [Pyrinomonadaceae bacterium]|nr:hypothetical protein [Pyrinomonadaceae bacterium]
GPSHEEIRLSPVSRAAFSLFAILCGRAPVTHLAFQACWLPISIAVTSACDGIARSAQCAYREKAVLQAVRSGNPVLNRILGELRNR